MIDKLGLVEFLLYIAPGFLARQIYLSVYPAKKTDDYHQIGWAVLYSIWIVTTIKAADTYLLDHQLHSDATGMPYARFIIVTQIAGVAVGLGLIGNRMLRYLLANKFEFLSSLAPDPQSIWARVNDSSNTDWAIVFLDDGSVYRGYISEFQFDPDANDQDFLLSEASRVDENLNVLYELNGLGVYLNTKTLKRIEFVK